MSAKTVSIIIPFFSQINWLTEAVESVLKQSFKNYEIFLINDGSKEDLSAFLKKYKNIITYICKENGGAATARNYGIEKAQGKYIAFLDADDIWEVNKLEKQVNLMEEHNAIWSHSSYYFFKEKNNQEKRLINLSYFQGNIFPRCLASTPIATPCVMIRRDFLQKNKHLRFNEKMPYGEDWYLWILLAIKAPLFVLKEPLVKVRLRGNNASKRAKVQISSKATIWKIMKTNPKQFLEKRKVNFIIRFAYKLCSLGNKMVIFAEKNISNKNNFTEILSKLFYLAPYIILKSLDKHYFKK